MYETLLDGLGDQRIFVTYDHGKIEIMSPSRRHEIYGDIIAAMIREVTVALGIPLASGGMTTFKRKDLDRGLEPDKCFWIKSESRVRGVMDVDLAIHPAPDLAIEIEITRRISDRESIYVDLGVAELWRHDGRHLRIQHLVSGKYRDRPRSKALPMLPPAVVDRFLRLVGKKDETSIIRAFRAWMCDELVEKHGRRRGRKRP